MGKPPTLEEVSNEIDELNKRRKREEDRKNAERQAEINRKKMRQWGKESSRR